MAENKQQSKTRPQTNPERLLGGRKPSFFDRLKQGFTKALPKKETVGKALNKTGHWLVKNSGVIGKIALGGLIMLAAYKYGTKHGREPLTEKDAPRFDIVNNTMKDSLGQVHPTFDLIENNTKTGVYETVRYRDVSDAPTDSLKAWAENGLNITTLRLNTQGVKIENGFDAHNKPLAEGVRYLWNADAHDITSKMTIRGIEIPASNTGLISTNPRLDKLGL